MPRRKQGHSQAAKRIASSIEKSYGRYSTRRATSRKETKLRAIPSTRKSGRSSLRSKAALVRTARGVSEIVTPSPETKTRYLHKKFQRIDCLPVSSEQYATSSQESSGNGLEKGAKASSTEQCCDEMNCETSKSSKALEALLKVTEMEIIRSSTGSTMLTQDSDGEPSGKRTMTDKHVNKLSVNSDDSVPTDCRAETDEQSKMSQMSTEKPPKPSDISSQDESEPKKVKSYRHVCTYCDHTFAKPSVLKKHIRAHTNERPYPCKVCGFAFKTKSNLYKHCRSRAHSLKITSENSCTTAGETGIGECNEDSTDDDDDNKISDSENSCDTVISTCSAKLSVPNRCSEVDGEAKQRIPPIKIQTLLQQNQMLVSRLPTGFSSSLVENEKPTMTFEQMPTKVLSKTAAVEVVANSHEKKDDTPNKLVDLPQNKSCIEVSSMIYKPKFHSAIIGGSRKFIDHRTFSVESTSDKVAKSFEAGDSVISSPSKDNDMVTDNDGLMLRVMDRKSDSAKENQANDSPPTTHSEAVVSNFSELSFDAAVDAEMSSKTISMTKIEYQSEVRATNSVASDQASNESLSAKQISKTPRTTASREYLQQHISNLISRNTAIVETLNPLWSRRYLRQSSVASSQNIDAELRARDKNRHYSSHVSQGKFGVYKKGDGEIVGRQLSGSQSLPATPSIVLSAPSFTGVVFTEVKNQLINLAIPSQPESQISKDVLVSTPNNVINDSLENGMVGSKFTTGNLPMVPNLSSSWSNTENLKNRDMISQHPQNPEGSIIKNLLLKKRSSPLTSNTSTSANAYASSPTLVLPNALSLSPLTETVTDLAPVRCPSSELQSQPLHTCSVCQTSFRNVETLLAHQSHYCKKNSRNVSQIHGSNTPVGDIIDGRKCESRTIVGSKSKHSDDVVPKPRGRPKGSKNRPKDISVAISNSGKNLSSVPMMPKYSHSVVSSPPYGSTEAHGKTLDALKGKLHYRHSQDDESYGGKLQTDPIQKRPILENKLVMESPVKPLDEFSDDGLILKKHLLLGSLNGDKSPPLKKRRLPEVTMPKVETPKLNLTSSLSTLRSLEELSRYPMRPSAVQMFGGEVQICDGGETKKMRIDTKIQQPASVSAMLASSTTSVLSDNMVPVISHVKSPSDGLSSSAVIVNIAKPVLNSGGTMMQMQEIKTPAASPVCIPVVALGQPLMATGIASSSSSGSSCSTPERRISQSRKFNEVGAVVLSANIPTSLPVSSAEFYSIDISHLQINSVITSRSQSFGNKSMNIPTTAASQLPGLNCQKPLIVALDEEQSEKKLDMDKTPPELTPSVKENKTPSLVLPPVPSINIFPAPDKNAEITQPLPPRAESLKMLRLEKDLTCNLPFMKVDGGNIQLPSIQISSSPSKESVATSTSTTTTTTTSSMETSKSFLAPPRPTTLPLKSRSCMMGTTLISPETPRPKKKIGQLYINGQYYTYLGLKCSTRVYYCCIYRPQPMYVPQATDPKLSMYSNWQTVPADDDSIHLTPAAAMACYISKPRSSRYVMAGPKKMQYLLTHSSYWTFKAKKENPNEKSTEEEVEEEDVEIPTASESSQDVVIEEKITKSNPTEEEGTRKPEQMDTLEQDSSSSFSITPGTKQKSKEPSETSTESSKRVKIFEGGFKSNEEYTYVRGRGRGKYICEECGIRCKKPSMLKKHIRTHTDVRPFTCKHCNFSFKTKGNLTKHMKSKAHHKKCIELGIDPIPVTIEEEQIDEEALAKQERYEKDREQFIDDDDETDDEYIGDDDDDDEDDEDEDDDEEDEDDESVDGSMYEGKSCSVKTKSFSQTQFEDAVEECQPSNLQPSQPAPVEYPEEHEAAKSLIDLSNHGKMSVVTKEKNFENSSTTLSDQTSAKENESEKEAMKPEQSKLLMYLPEEVIEDSPGVTAAIGKSDELIGNPRVVWESNQVPNNKSDVEQPTGNKLQLPVTNVDELPVEKSTLSSFPLYLLSLNDSEMQDQTKQSPSPMNKVSPDQYSSDYMHRLEETEQVDPVTKFASSLTLQPPAKPTQLDALLSVSNNREVSTSSPAVVIHDLEEKRTVRLQDEYDQPMDLSLGSCRVGEVMGQASSHANFVEKKNMVPYSSYVIGQQPYEEAEMPFFENAVVGKEDLVYRENISEAKVLEMYETISPPLNEMDQSRISHAQLHMNGVRIPTEPSKKHVNWEFQAGEKPNPMPSSYVVEKTYPEKNTAAPCNDRAYNVDPSPLHSKRSEYVPPTSLPSASSVVPAHYTSKFETMSLSKPPRLNNLSSSMEESKHAQAKFLLPSGSKLPAFSHRATDDGKCICDICDKSFTKPSQLRLHVNIHYFERPFRCDSCAVSFRTKGHLQKHRRSVSHYNKVNMNMTFGTPTTDNPRPFKCADCKIAFRIHGHLAKHLRSKMHIMKLECLGKLPFGTYAEIERSGANLNEIDTTDCENSLESLQVMAQRLYEKDIRRPHWPRERTVSGCSADDASDISQVTDDSLEGNRYRSLSMSDASRLTPEFNDIDGIVISSDHSHNISDVKREPVDMQGSNEMYRRDHWNALRQSSMESLTQEYEDISDAESELDPAMNCSICGQVFKDIKALHLHLYLDHSENRSSSVELAVGIDNKGRPPSSYASPVQMRNVNSPEDPSVTIEMRMNNHPHNVSVAMEMRRNTLSENAAIAMEMRRKKLSANSSDVSAKASVSTTRRELYQAATPVLSEDMDGNKHDGNEVKEARKMMANNTSVRGGCNMTKVVEPVTERTVIFSISQSPPSTSHHFSEVSDTRTAVCDICGSIFNSQSLLKQHMLTHVQLRPFICKFCDAGFTSKEYLYHHVSSHHQNTTLDTDIRRPEYVEPVNSSSGTSGQIPIR